MKKLLLAAALVSSACIGANAQEKTYFAPEQGDFGVEVRFNPFGESNFTLNDYELKGRYFVTDKDALVLQFGINGVNKKSVGVKEADNGDYILNDDAWNKYYYGTFNIDLGYERHFFNYKRIDLYAVARIGYGHSFAGQTIQADANNKVSFTNFCLNGDDEDDVKAVASNNLRFAVFTGIDFYVYKGLYLGAEIGLGLEDRFGVARKTKFTSNGTVTEHKSEVGGHDFEISTYVTPTFRLGWTF